MYKNLCTVSKLLQEEEPMASDFVHISLDCMLKESDVPQDCLERRS
jgi:hypothetical protein